MLMPSFLKSSFRLNEIGRIVENEWIKLPERFNNVVLDMFQIMPNHFHGIFQIVGAGLAPAPDNLIIRLSVIMRRPQEIGRPQGSPLRRMAILLGHSNRWLQTNV
jgi:hypothetical protein